MQQLHFGRLAGCAEVVFFVVDFDMGHGERYF
jgi:hypothetical protein